MDSSIQWIPAILRTVRFKNIHQISIGFARKALTRLSRAECSDLDSLLAHFQTSHPFRLKVIHEPGDDPEGLVAQLLPKTTKRGIVDVVECSFVEPPY
jgi:hypothetical protein